MGGWSFADAIDFEMPADTVLAPGEYLVVARDAASLQDKYPTIEIVGDFSRNLSDREDRILLIDANGNPADEVHYFESGRWSLYADGGGSSDPLNEEWDTLLLDTFRSGDLSPADQWDNAWFLAEGGSAAHEMRSWIAAYAALSTAGAYEFPVDHYWAVKGWAAGFAIQAARTA